MSDTKQDFRGYDYSIGYILSCYFYTESKKQNPPKHILKPLSKLILKLLPNQPAHQNDISVVFSTEKVIESLNKLKIFYSNDNYISDDIDNIIKYLNDSLDDNLTIENVNSKETLEKYLNYFAIQNSLTIKQLKQDIVYLLMCKSLSSLSKAKRLQVGEIIVTEQETLLPGYNGTAPNTSNECEYTDPNTGKLISYEHIICGLQNAVYKAAKQGVSVVGSTAYSTHSPCVRCVPVTLSVGIKRFVYTTKYRLVDHLDILKENKIELLQIPSNILEAYQRYYQ